MVLQENSIVKDSYGPDALESRFIEDGLADFDAEPGK